MFTSTSKKESFSKSLSGEVSVQNRLRTRVSAIALGSLFLSANLSNATFAAGDSDATPATSAPNKQLAAIELPGAKAKDAATQATPGARAEQTTTTSPTAAAQTAAATQTSASASPTPTTAGGASTDLDGGAPKLLLKKGQPLILGSEQEDVQPTDDVELAKEQALHFPDSAEASFVLAVALTRTSRVEEALAEVRRARKLAQAAGGPVYFDKMIKSYEDMLQDTEDPRVRYSLAWAYYMKAYLLAQDSRRAMSNPQLQAAQAAQAAQSPAATQSAPAGQTSAQTIQTSENKPAADAAAQSSPAAQAPANTTVPSTVSAKAERKKVDPAMAIMLMQGLNPAIAAKMAQPQSGKLPAAQLPMIPTAIQKAAPSAVPQVHQYYAEALKNLDAVLAKKPDDVWALLYRWHLYAEDTGNLGEAMKQWREAEHRFPGNPGVQLFLAEGYAKEGNLKEAIMHASKAVFLRGTGN